MKVRTAIILVAAVLALADCGPARIEKLPVPREQEIRAIRLMAEADELLQDGKDHLALLKYLEAAEANPYHEVIFNKLAVTYSRLHMFYQARQAVERSIGLEPDYSYAYNTKGIIDIAELKYGDATSAFHRAIRLKQEVANFHVNLGYAEMQRGHYEAGLEAYKRALEIDPDILSSNSAIELNFPTEAEPSPDQYYEMAKAFADLGSLDYCIKYLGQAISAGFRDFAKILNEEAFQKFRNEDEFVRFLQVYGISS